MITVYELEGRAGMVNLPVGRAGAFEPVLVCIHQCEGASLLVLNDAGGIVTSLAIYGDLAEALPHQLQFRDAGDFVTWSRAPAAMGLERHFGDTHGPLTIARAARAVEQGVSSRPAAIEQAISVSRACSALANSLPGLIEMRGLQDLAISNPAYYLAAA